MVSEPTLVGPKSMASANKMFRLKYSCEEVYERMDKGLCIFCEELDTPGHHDLKHKGIQIFIVDDDLASDDVEEFHQTQETVTNPEPIMETAKNLDSFIEPLEHESISQVVGSVSDVMLVHKVDSHVKEVEELPQKSTSGNGENVAHQLFDQMPQRKASKEKQRKYLKAWKFKFKPTSKRRKSMDVKFFSVEEIACFTKDSKKINWGCVNKEFKEAVAGCGKKIFDRFKLVDETSKPAVCDGPIQIRVWESGGSLLERVDEESSGDAKFHLKHKWRSRVLQTLSGLECCLLPAKLDLRDWPKEESTPHKKKSHQIETFQVSLSSLEPGRRSHKESLVVVNDLSSDLGCVIGKTIGCTCDSEIGQDNSLDEEEFNRVWEPGGLLIEHDKWKGLEKCYKHGRLMRLMHWLSRMWWKESKSREFDRVSACSCVDLKTWHCVKHETQQTDFHVWHRWKNKAEKLPATYALLELMMLGLVSFQPNKGNDVVGLFPKATVLREVSHCRSNDYGTIRHKLVLVRDTSSDGYKEDSWSFIRFILKELCSAGYEWENETIKESFKGLSKQERDHMLLFPKNQKLLNPEARFCTQHNDLKQLSTEFQGSLGLNYFTYLIFIWNQTLNCGCEAGHIISGFFIGDVHEFFTCSKFQNGDETYGKKLLDVNEVSLLDNDNKVDFTIKASWCYHKPMIREVFHLQRPPEVIDLHGNLDFITKVIVHWKEHPPDQFSQAFMGKYLCFHP